MIRYYVYAYVMFRSQLKRGADCKCYTDNIIGNLINKVLDETAHIIYYQDYANSLTNTLNAGELKV